MTQLAAIETLVIEPTLTGEHGRNRGLGRRQITANDDRSGTATRCRQLRLSQARNRA